MAISYIKKNVFNRDSLYYCHNSYSELQSDNTLVMSSCFVAFSSATTKSENIFAFSGLRKQFFSLSIICCFLSKSKAQSVSKASVFLPSLRNTSANVKYAVEKLGLISMASFRCLIDAAVSFPSRYSTRPKSVRLCLWKGLSCTASRYSFNDDKP